MKKRMMSLVAVTGVILLLALSIISAQEYKVTKKESTAEKSAQIAEGKSVSVLKILVTNSKTGKATVKVTIPLSLAELVANCEGEHFNLHDHCQVDLKKILSELKKNGPMTLIEVEEDDETVKIWLE